MSEIPWEAIEKRFDDAEKNEKIRPFLKELNFISNPRIRQFTENILTMLPDYFFIIPASSTGKYHPSYTLGEGGLTKHVKAAIRIAHGLTCLYDFTELDKDVIFSALILHDGMKNGLKHSRYTVHEHPLVMSDFIKAQNNIISPGILNAICGCIESHMGQWISSKYSKIVLPLPKTNFKTSCIYVIISQLESTWNLISKLIDG